jgi:hypothetical protein
LLGELWGAVFKVLSVASFAGFKDGRLGFLVVILDGCMSGALDLGDALMAVVFAMACDPGLAGFLGVRGRGGDCEAVVGEDLGTTLLAAASLDVKILEGRADVDFVPDTADFLVVVDSLEFPFTLTAGNTASFFWGASGLDDARRFGSAFDTVGRRESSNGDPFRIVPSSCTSPGTVPALETP